MQRMRAAALKDGRPAGKRAACKRAACGMRAACQRRLPTCTRCAALSPGTRGGRAAQTLDAPARPAVTPSAVLRASFPLLPQAPGAAMPCPFALSAADVPEGAEHDRKGCKSGKDAAAPAAKQSACPFAGAGAAAGADDRFDFDKDPVSWFYQNQIRGEEEFQARREQLRREARARLDGIFARKGKALRVDSDDDDFSVCSDEVSAWDSELHSLASMDSCARSWAAEAGFRAPALSALAAALAGGAAAGGLVAWRAATTLLQVNRFWAVVVLGWLPSAGLAVGAGAVLHAPLAWWAAGARAKRALLASQLMLHVLFAASALLSMLCWVHPSRVDEQLQASACRASDGVQNAARLCRLLPVVQEQVSLGVAGVGIALRWLAAATLAATAAGSWHVWELTRVERKADKHRRRRRQRRACIPWEKVKVEDLGPVSYCGGGPPPRAGGRGAKAGAAAPAIEECKKVV